MAPLPLQAETLAVEVVGGLGQGRFFSRNERTVPLILRLLPDGDGFADAVAIDVDAYQRPVVLPAGGLQMDYAAQGGRLLEMIEPPLALWRINEGSLVRAVHGGGALFQHHALLVWTIDVLGTEYRLPARADTTFRDNQIVPAIALEPFRALSHRARINCHPIVEQRLAVGRHLVDDDGASAVLAPR